MINKTTEIMNEIGIMRKTTQGNNEKKTRKETQQRIKYATS